MLAEKPALHTKPDVSIIIVAYNSADVIGACLSSIAAEGDELAFETLVVDNDSTDAARARARDLETLVAEFLAAPD